MSNIRQAAAKGALFFVIVLVSGCSASFESKPNHPFYMAAPPPPSLESMYHNPDDPNGGAN